MLAVLLAVLLLGPILEPDAPAFDPTWNPRYQRHPVCEELRGDPYLSNETLRMCEQIVPFFRTRSDQIHAVGVVQGETDGRGCLANDERWGHLRGGKPEGCWSLMTHLDWAGRMLGPEWDALFGWAGPFDPRNIVHASYLASLLVYERPSSWLGFHHWWSIHYGPLNRFLIRWGITPIRHCPDRAYWNDVPSGSGIGARQACTG